MSFGFSIGDLAALISLTKKTYNSWQQAPKEYADVVQTLSESKTLLCHVQNRFETLTTGPGNDAGKQQDIETLLRGCQSAVSDLRAVVKRRRKLGHWDRIRLGSGGSGHVHECRARLARHISVLTPFLFSLELESIGKEVGSLPAILERLPQAVANALPAALGKMIDERIEDARTARGSDMTTFGEDDDKMAWRELRRNLRGLGVGDEVVRKQRGKLVEFVKTLTRDDQSMAASEVSESEGEEEAVSMLSPLLVPEVVDAAEEVEIALEPLGGTRARCQYQAYVETEDEDDSMESPIAGPSNDGTAKRSNNDKGSTARSNEAHVAEKAERRARDRHSPGTTQGAGGTTGLRKNTESPKRRRKYQAYVETEDEEDIQRTPPNFLSDVSTPGLSDTGPQSSQKDPVIGTNDHKLSSTELDDDTPPQTPHVDAAARPKTRRNMRAHDLSDSEAADQPKPQTKPRRSSRTKRTRSRASAVCGDLEYQKCLDSPSESEDSNSVAVPGSRNSYCSSCDQQLTSGDEDSWEQLSINGSNWSGSEQHSEVDDGASKIAHSGQTDVEDAYPTKVSQEPSARRPTKNQKRTRRNAKPSTPPSPPSSDVEPAAPHRRPNQRMIEYKPLQASEEGLLTVQLHMPAGYSVHVEGGRIAQFHNPCVPNTWRQYFASLPPNKEYHPSCLHGFPGAPLTGRIARCGCQVFRWTPGMQYWNPTFLDGLREWVMG